MPSHVQGLFASAAAPAAPIAGPPHPCHHHPQLQRARPPYPETCRHSCDTCLVARVSQVSARDTFLVSDHFFGVAGTRSRTGVAASALARVRNPCPGPALGRKHRSKRGDTRRGTPAHQPRKSMAAHWRAALASTLRAPSPSPRLPVGRAEAATRIAAVVRGARVRARARAAAAAARAAARTTAAARSHAARASLRAAEAARGVWQVCGRPGYGPDNILP
jgi:hypothetical protein